MAAPTTEQLRNVISIDGCFYATLDFESPSSTSKGDQTGALEVPEGWQVAPNQPEIAKNIIAKYPWGASVLIVSDGTEFGTSQHETPGDVVATDHLIIEKGGFKPKSLEGGDYHRILISASWIVSLSHASHICEQMWSTKPFSDCTIVCDGEVSHCHRAVLSSASPVFKCMFDSDMREGVEQRIEISDATPVIVQNMLEFMYTGKTHIKRQDLIPILAIADKYEIEELCIICGKLAIEHMDTDMAVAVVRTLRLIAGRARLSLIQQLKNKLKSNDDLLDAVIMGL